MFHVCQTIPKYCREVEVMPVTIKGKTYYRTNEVYQLAGVCRTTLYRWLKAGFLGETEYRDRRGWRLFTQEEVNLVREEAELITKTNRLKAKMEDNKSNQGTS